MFSTDRRLGSCEGGVGVGLVGLPAGVVKVEEDPVAEAEGCICVSSSSIKFIRFEVNQIVSC